MNLKDYYNNFYYKDVGEEWKASEGWIKLGEIMQGIVLKYFKMNNANKICDVGCGSGRGALFSMKKVLMF